jgi:hypothetical protein
LAIVALQNLIMSESEVVDVGLEFDGICAGTGFVRTGACLVLVVLFQG